MIKSAQPTIENKLMYSADFSYLQARVPLIRQAFPEVDNLFGKLMLHEIPPYLAEITAKVAHGVSHINHLSPFLLKLNKFLVEKAPTLAEDLQALATRLGAEILTPSQSALTIEALKALGEFAAHGSNELMLLHQEVLHPMADVNQALRIVDLYSGTTMGCGIPRFGRSWQITCVDKNPVMAGFLEGAARLYGASDRFNVRCQNVSDVDFRPQSVDILRSKNGMAYDPNELENLLRLSESVRPGGKLLFETADATNNRIQQADSVAVLLHHLYNRG